MGLWTKIKGEFIDIIEWLDPTQNTMAYRFERYNNEIKHGAKLTVRESQVAVFINEGQIADIFTPGMYTLQTQNLPILSTLQGWKHGFNSPFKAEVYFINTKQFVDLKWGTPNPVMLRDSEFGPIRIRSFGNYSIQITDVSKFIKGIVGTDGNFTSEKISEQLKSIAVTRFTDAIGESKIPVLDMAANYNEVSAYCETKIRHDFEEYGINLTKFLVTSITLPPAVEEALDKRSSMGIIGNMDTFMKYQTGEAMTAAANNPTGGEAASGMGLGMGFAMANQMMGSMGQNTPQQTPQQTQTNTPPPIPPAITYYTAINGQQSGPFDFNTLKTMASNNQITPKTLVWCQGMANWMAAEQVNELVTIFQTTPPPLPPTE